MERRPRHTSSARLDELELEVGTVKEDYLREEVRLKRQLVEVQSEHSATLIKAHQGTLEVSAARGYTQEHRRLAKAIAGAARAGSAAGGFAAPPGGF